jgi:hypothetical protein
MDFFRKTYKTFHGKDEGADKVLAQAKATAVPPPEFSIESATDAEKKQAEDLKARIDSDPGFGLWYTIRQNLTQDQGDAFFDKTVKNALIPGGAHGVRTFSGTVISIDPPDRPTKILVGVDDPLKPDATLEFSKPLPVSSLDKIKPGQKLQFSGVVSKYAKDPYMLTFEEPAIVGVQTSASGSKAATKRK